MQELEGSAKSSKQNGGTSKKEHILSIPLTIWAVNKLHKGMFYQSCSIWFCPRSLILDDNTLVSKVLLTTQPWQPQLSSEHLKGQFSIISVTPNLYASFTSFWSLPFEFHESKSFRLHEEYMRERVNDRIVFFVWTAPLRSTLTTNNMDWNDSL